MTYYKITNLETGCKDSPADFSFDGNLWSGKQLYSPHSITLIQGEGHNILVDTAINVKQPTKKALADTFFVQNCHDPAEVLSSIGVNAEDIDAVFLTHLHFDHAGGNDCFPNAVFYVQRAELEGWEKCIAHEKFSRLLTTIDPADFPSLRELEKQERLVLLDGDQENVLPGIDVLGFELEHSFASQVIVVHTETGPSLRDTEADCKASATQPDTQVDCKASTAQPDTLVDCKASTAQPDTLVDCKASAEVPGDNDVFLITGDIGRHPKNFLGTDESSDYLINIKFCIGSPYNLALAYDRIFQTAKGDVSRIIMAHDGTKAQRYPTYKTQLGLQVSVCNDPRHG